MRSNRLWRRCRPRTAALLLLAGIFLGGLPRPAPATPGDLPEPASGEWALTTFALLRHSHARCQSVSEQLLTYWRGLRAGGLREQEALANYVLNRATSEISEARATGDLVRRFLPSTRHDDPASAEVLERLFELESSLCDAVASPRPPREEFEARLEEYGDEIAQVEAELGRLLVASEPDLLRVLQPYLKHLEAAGMAAKAEYEAYLESLRPRESPPTVEELMAAWHQRYQAAARPTKEALGKYVRARRDNDHRALNPACREILAAVIPLLNDEEIFTPPDPEAGAPLRLAYRHIQHLAGACTAGDFRRVEENYQRMQKNLATARALLAKYQLQP